MAKENPAEDVHAQKGDREGAQSRIAVVFPVYKGSRLVVENTEFILSTFPYVRVYICADCIYDWFAKELKRLKDKWEGRIIINISNVRRGKVGSLNDILSEIKENLIFFFDADTEIPKDPEFFNKALRDIGDAQYAEIKKVGKISNKKKILSKMASYDYLGMNIISLCHTKLGKSIAINGTAFFIRKDALEKIGGFKRMICEDMQLGTDCYRKNMKYGYVNSTFVYVYPLESWKRWLEQRKRWSYGCGEWLVKNKKDICQYVAKYPVNALASILFISPGLLLLLTLLSVSPALLKVIIALLLLLTPLYMGMGALGVVAPLAACILLATPKIMVILLAIFSIIYGALAFKVGKRLDGYFLLYLLIYSPIWFFYGLFFIILYVLGIKIKLRDWKV